MCSNMVNSLKNSLPLSTVTVLDKGYLVNQADSTLLDTRSAHTEGTAHISNQPVAQSIIVTACK